MVWKSPLAAGYSGLSVVGNRVYTMDRPPEPTDRERVVCLDATTGKPVWEYVYPAPYGKLDYGKGPRATPTIFDGHVYTFGAVGHLFCLDAASGQVVWSKDLVADHKAQQPTWGFAASPVIHEGKVIIHAGLKGNGCFTAYDAKTGVEVWRGGGDPAGYGTPILVKHAGVEQLIGWTPENIVGLSPSTGRLQWSVPYKITYGVSIATPIYREGLALVCGYWDGSKAIKLGAKPHEAELAWEENRYLRGLMAQPLYRDGLAYLLDKQHGLVCFELATGKKIWTDENRLTPRGQNPQASLVWLGESNRALALNSDGELILCRLSRAGYEEQSRAKIVGETWAHPAFAGNLCYARDDEQVICVRVGE